VSPLSTHWACKGRKTHFMNGTGVGYRSNVQDNADQRYLYIYIVTLNPIGIFKHKTKMLSLPLLLLVCHLASRGKAGKLEKQQLGLWSHQLIFMFYIIPSDKFNTPDQINNLQEGGKKINQKESDPWLTCSIAEGVKSHDFPLCEYIVNTALNVWKLSVGLGKCCHFEELATILWPLG